METIANRRSGSTSTGRTQLQEAAARRELYEELAGKLLKKAGLTQKQLYEHALHKWVAGSLDLLTPAERKKYARIIL